MHSNGNKLTSNDGLIILQPLYFHVPIIRVCSLRAAVLTPFIFGCCIYLGLFLSSALTTAASSSACTMFFLTDTQNRKKLLFLVLVPICSSLVCVYVCFQKAMSFRAISDVRKGCLGSGAKQQIREITSKMGTNLWQFYAQELLFHLLLPRF